MGKQSWRNAAKLSGEKRRALDVRDDPKEVLFTTLLGKGESLVAIATQFYQDGMPLGEVESFFSQREFPTNLLKQEGGDSLWIGEKGEEYSPDSPRVTSTV